ncbi:MAG: hypothetical protein ACRDE5_16770 [Ginsengibacter sp.]
MKKLFSLISILFVILIFIGCGPSAVVVRTRPAPPYYARPISPGPEFVWVEGEWVRQNHGYVYHQGYWTRPHARYRRYEGGHWQHRRGGWYWAPGHWY